MKKIIAILVLFLFVALVWFAALPYAINAKLQAHLANLGYQNTTIGHIEFGLKKIVAQNIELNDTAKTSIKTIRIGASPLSILMGHSMNGVLIDGLVTQLHMRDLRSAVHDSATLSFFSLIDIPAENIEMKNFEIIVPIKEVKQTITGHIHIKGAPSDHIKMVTGVLKNNSSLTSISSHLNGKIDSQGNGILHFRVEDVDFNTAFFNMTRTSGWLDYKKAPDTPIELSGQIDAGAGSVFKTALKNMSVVLGKARQTDDIMNLVLRAKAAGVDDATLSTDIEFSHVQKKIIAAQSVIDTKAFGDFLRYLKKNNSSIVNEFPNLLALKETQITINFLPEKRFADGPLPFDLNVIATKQNIMTGTFLVYPNDMQIRGSAETDINMTNDIKSLLSLTDEQVSDNVLRLDGNLKSAVF